MTKVYISQNKANFVMGVTQGVTHNIGSSEAKKLIFKRKKLKQKLIRMRKQELGESRLDFSVPVPASIV